MVNSLENDLSAKGGKTTECSWTGPTLNRLHERERVRVGVLTLFPPQKWQGQFQEQFRRLHGHEVTRLGLDEL